MRILSQAEQFPGPTRLYRGLSIPPFLDRGISDRLRAVLSGQEDPTLGPELLDRFSRHSPARGGLGRHWSTQPGVAHYFANGREEEDDDDPTGLRYTKAPHDHTPLVLEAEWGGDPADLEWGDDDFRGQEEWTGGDYHYEHERTLRSGVPLNITGLQYARDWGKYRNLLADPYEGRS